jgi:pilus assembly protein TadC
VRTPPARPGSSRSPPTSWPPASPRARPGEAADAVGSSLGGPLGQSLTRIAAELRLGGDPAVCWARLGSHDLGRCLERASSTGIPPVGEVSRLAAGYRAERSRAALVRARRAGVLATAPLGLCFLPGFLLIGVAPVVVSLAGSILAAGSI